MVGARPRAAALLMRRGGCPAEEAGSGRVSGLACDGVETFSVVCYLLHASKQSPVSGCAPLGCLFGCAGGAGT